MPGIKFTQLVEQFVQTLERTGASVLIESLSSIRPAYIQVSTEVRIRCGLYLWAITPGGGSGGERPIDERRIQFTSLKTMGFPHSPGTRTIVGGYSAETDTWAFWDARRHMRFSSKSPSHQIKLGTLERARHDGIATQLRPVAVGNEVVVATDPASLLWYTQHGEGLHNSEADCLEVHNLLNAKPEEERQFIDEMSDSPVSAARRVDLIETLRSHRDSRFRPAVLAAYRNQCAVCQTALKLVDAAHIVPVSHPTSTDDVTNGIALCRLHHGAYDAGLLGITSKYRLVVNPSAIDRLKNCNLHSGLDEFQQRLPSQIMLPNAIEVRPHPAHLRLGMQLRAFPDSLIQ